MSDKTLNIKGTLMSLSTPVVMGILNVTPDSFYAGSRKQTEADIEERIQAILSEGGQIIDVGGYSSRPDAEVVSPEEEMERLAFALKILNAHYPEAVVSVDTFRADVARKCVEDYGVAIINDISGGDFDSDMFPAVASLGLPYILMHTKGMPDEMVSNAHYKDVTGEVAAHISRRIEKLRAIGFDNIIVDPGFGFAKDAAQNFRLMKDLGEFKKLGYPVLVGISRKGMIWKTLGITPDEALNGTTVLNTAALLHGADILRVHDVKEAVQAVKLVSMLGID